MQINVYEMIEDDKFFIGSYPDNFSKGRWFTVEELIYSSYEKIEAEYLDKYNPNGQPELELGVFDVDNVSGLWSGEYDVSSLINKLREIESTGYYEIDLEIYEFTEEFFEETGMSIYDVARAVYLVISKAGMMIISVSMVTVTLRLILKQITSHKLICM